MNARGLLHWIVGAGALATAIGPAAAEERTVQAMAPIQGSGEVFVVGPGKTMIVGSMVGILYLEGRQAPLDDVTILCPAIQTLDAQAKRAEATGHCTFTLAEGDEAYSEWKCTGMLGACEGHLTITGGIGKFKGISGGGKMVVRTALTETAASLSHGGTITAATGLAVWPALKYRIP